MASGFIAKQNQKGCISTKLIGKAKVADMQDKARMDIGLPVRQGKERCCLKCNERFQSRAEQRICDSCTETNRQYGSGFW